MVYSTLFFDLDETLYPAGTGLWKEIAGRISLYMSDHMNFHPEQVSALRERYFLEYGTTLRGLQANHTVDTEEYLAFVHDVPLEKYIKPDMKLRRIIEDIPARKYVFTNADANHVNRVLDIIGLQGLFDGIIDIHVIAPYCKPMPGSFLMALKAAGAPDPKTCALLDDQARITRAARTLGMFTILVGKESAGEEADIALLYLSGLSELLTEKL